MKDKEELVDEIVDLIKGANKKGSIVDKEGKYNQEKVVSLHEWIIIKGSKKEKKVKAKIDTGASDSSISVRLFKEIGETPVVKEVLVERAHESEKRPVVRLQLNVIDVGRWIESEFTISNRENMEYEVLLGDNTLKKLHVLVNPEED